MGKSYSDSELTTLESNVADLESKKRDNDNAWWWSEPAGRARAIRSLANLRGNPPTNATTSDNIEQRYKSLVSRVEATI